MIAGKIVYWDRFEMTATMGCSISFTDITQMGGIANGLLRSYDCPDPATKQVGIEIVFLAQQDPIHTTGTSHVTINIPEIGYSHTVTQTGFVSGQSGMVAINGLGIYQSSGGWGTSWTSIEIWINGTLITTIGASAVTSTRLAPTGISLLGVPPMLQGSCGPNPVLVVGIPPAFNFVQDVHVSVGCNVSGGWRFRETSGGPWVTLPVDLQVLMTKLGITGIGSSFLNTDALHPETDIKRVW